MPARLAALTLASALPLPLALALGGTASAATTVADVGHRGASAYAPENTLAAFRQAKTRHADYFELDVQQTKDHQLIVMHDTTLSRTTNVEKVYPHGSPWRIRDYTLKQIKRLDAGSWFSSKYKGERVPTLDETLRTMQGQGLKLLLEIKNPSLYPGMTARIAAELRTEPYWLRPGRLIVQSFDWSSLKSFHKLLPSVPLGVLGKPTTSELPAVAKYARYVNPKYTTVGKSYVASVKKRHLKVFVYVVNDRSTMRRMIGYGVNGIITNRPDTLRSVLKG
ncbi:glycerophosphodiester phosphodiesterase [Actinoallomurus soli]|uniref:glycerophosphodiester phosphodiesterase n=1 Tax=Actinoallomurus soli TaxID=2952535 RepID=UPI002093A0A0|nr:glycerophosphodiester phosphodiesterase family protein [Actinoallomurus soli]MCO5967354.1 glycerophosphodiester phosphodiesterase [Actinoallomurus soli]